MSGVGVRDSIAVEVEGVGERGRGVERCVCCAGVVDVTSAVKCNQRSGARTFGGVSLKFNG